MRKIEIKSFAIGVLSCVCVLLFIGASSDDHKHGAVDIEYHSFQYGQYGSVQKAIKDLEDKVEELESKINTKAEDYHHHY